MLFTWTAPAIDTELAKQNICSAELVKLFRKQWKYILFGHMFIYFQKYKVFACHFHSWEPELFPDAY